MIFRNGSGRDGRLLVTSRVGGDAAEGAAPRPPRRGFGLTGPGGGPRRPRFRLVRRLLGGGAAVLLLVTLAGGMVAWTKYEQLVADLPTVDGLRTYQPPVMSRLYSGDDRVMAELAAERRIFVPYSAIPARVKNAVIAAEDQKFYTHGGVDPFAILRAGLTDLTVHRGHRPLGASTITQQVARIMLLGSKQTVSLERKAKEALLAIRIEQTLPKEKILEIYLNEIYLGAGAYGVGAAAQTYFNKPLDQVDDAEAAFLGALPKSPTNYNPYRFPDAAKGRRDWVLQRMADIGAISGSEARAAQDEPLVPQSFTRPGPVPGSEWFGEEVRRELIERYGQDTTMQGGLLVHTSMDPHLQQVATAAVRDGLMSYDRDHGGWRGPVEHLADIASGADSSQWVPALARAARPAGMLESWRLGVLLSPATGEIGWLEGPAARAEPRTGRLLARDMAWMRRMRAPRAGDLLMVEPQAEGGGVALRQVPKVEGALVTLDVRTGRVLAMVGGWSFGQSQFNRATQALRQPGSSFKPFVYLTAMEQGISPSQKFDDSPVSYGTWHPNNYEKDFWGPTTLHDALRESRNLVTIRLAAHIGMKSVANMATSLQLVDTMPHVLPAALGAVETTVLREAGAYASIAAGGRLVTPTLIDNVQDRDGHVLWQPPGMGLQAATPAPAGPTAAGAAPQPAAGGQAPISAVAAVAAAMGAPADGPVLVDTRPQVASPASAYQIVAMMRDVILRGTGTRAGEGLDRPIAGKTGTSQNFNDAWFAGFSPDIVTIVWVGFDTPQTLGKNETGGTIAGPIWNRVMKAVLADRPKLDFAVPPGLTLARYDTGMGMAVDAFKPDQVPGISADLNANATGALTAEDTGAETMPDSESDMAASPSAAPAGGAATGPAAVPGQPAAPAAPGAGGDIGMGGLY
ncbi:penicillin-binding protein 1A [Gluconacetobacter takamatsuzukensis]|uniref:Penicillin-binding protein 1A n=1 Tax=Gluconacetobacter takamatsuzukensis TaxID=1286190 RepID=A0A7W4KBR6_9PROT|nr:PBP1A family penicillin-binding protein [Gluconacetobacter takamatsuzukensis]MBB2204014.1 PBP1A family penicillin-binding protein [Gluconacetobacter takamatsuzukensis]